MGKKHLAALAGTMVLITSGTIMLSRLFSEKSTTQMLEAQTGRTVKIGTFNKTYFPPGFIARDIRFLSQDHPDKGGPAITIEELVVKADWVRIVTFTRVISQVDIYKLHLRIPARGPGELISPKKLDGKGVNIISLSVHEATLDFLPNEDSLKQGVTEPYREQILRLLLSDVGENRELGFETLVQNTLPNGEIHSKGRFGPWNSKDPARTPIRATYTFQNARLSDLPGISGMLQAQGRFWGTLDRQETEGEANVPDFRVSGSTHMESLHTIFQGVVDTRKGDVILKRVDTTFGSTTVHAEGTISGEGRPGNKTAVMTASVSNGRVDDLEKMFSHSRTPPLTGKISLHTSIRLTPGQAAFLKRLEMAGDFSTTSGRFTNPKTQDMLNQLTRSAQSRREQNVDNQSVSSYMRSHVVVKGGVAHIENLVLEAPNTTAHMAGTFDLVSKEVDLHGTLKTDGKLSDTQAGFKAFAVKMITPFLKKQHSSVVVPFVMKGTYANISTRLDLPVARKF